jgi:hypothetical protein
MKRRGIIEASRFRSDTPNLAIANFDYALADIAGESDISTVHQGSAEVHLASGFRTRIKLGISILSGWWRISCFETSNALRNSSICGIPSV